LKGSSDEVSMQYARILRQYKNLFNDFVKKAFYGGASPNVDQQFTSIRRYSSCLVPLRWFQRRADQALFSCFFTFI
jgi:hypothetical protein